MPDHDQNQTVNWVQLSELIGDEDDQSQRELLGEMWRDMVKDVHAGWNQVDSQADPQELKRDLHRIRGLISMWGVDALAQILLAIEHDPDPVNASARQAANIGTLWAETRGGIEQRYPWLAAM